MRLQILDPDIISVPPDGFPSTRKIAQQNKYLDSIRKPPLINDWFLIRKEGLFRPGKEIEGLRGGILSGMSHKQVR